jgi:hypothetical protein
MVWQVTRREFLLATSASCLASIVHVPFDWRFSKEESNTLFIIVRTLFPLEGADYLYRKAVEALELRRLTDSHVFETITAGLASMPKWGEFTRAGSPDLVAVLKNMEKSEFYALIYCETLEAVYGSSDAWACLKGLGSRGNVTAGS